MWLLSTVHGQAEGVCETRRGPRHVQGLLPLSDFSLFFFFSGFWPSGGQPQSLQVVQSYSDKDTFVPVFCFSAEPDGWLGCGDVFSIRTTSPSLCSWSQRSFGNVSALNIACNYGLAVSEAAPDVHSSSNI